MTVTGLNSVLLATLTTWQQVILFILIIGGSLTSVSIVTLLIRRQFFKRKFRYLIATSPQARRRVNAIAKHRENIIEESETTSSSEKHERPATEEPSELRHGVVANVITDEPDDVSAHPPAGNPLPYTPPSRATTTPFSRSVDPQGGDEHLPPRSRTIAFNEPRRRRPDNAVSSTAAIAAAESLSPAREPSLRLHRVSARMPGDSAMDSGYGGFPGPVTIATYVAGAVSRRLTSRQEEPPRPPGVPFTRTATQTSYLTFEHHVGRNSTFKGLTTEQQEELGGIEYRALTILLRITVVYWLLIQLLGVLAVAPYLAASSRWSAVLAAPDTDVNVVWFSFFQVWSAFGNCGLSLHDSSMVPFQEAYWFQIVVGFLILAGNTGYPIFLRLIIWTTAKLSPTDSRTRETLQFLLDHPRRCFLYLFPSHQTWLLVFILTALNCVDWVSFLVLDIGTPAIEAIAVGTRVFVGLFQAIAVRAAGFAIISMATIAPALQVLYVVMFQVAAYPIAISIRTTNTYEERSLGLYDDDESSEREADFEAQVKRGQAQVARGYIGYHLRKQLSFDQWWLVFALFWLCILERTNILSGDVPWVNIFSLTFEVSSAYGNVGLSQGNGVNNTSLAGVLRTVSKLILVAVMIRGRHRGLPAAIDRSVMLPHDLRELADDVSEALVDESERIEMRRRSTERYERTETLRTV